MEFDYDYGIDANGTLSPNYWNGNVLSITELGGSTVSYGYDDLNRLSAATRSGSHPFSHSYSYDANDNRTQVIADSTTTTFSYDPANQLIQEQTSIYQKSYSYDRNGNLVAYGGNSLVYDASNKWTSGTVDGTSVAFAYDGQGRRVSHTVGTARTDAWYDMTGLALETGSRNATYVRDPSGNLRSISSGGSVYNYAQDRLGSITGLVSTNGTLANTYTYDPWGQVVGTTGTVYNPYQYTGTYLDGATGLYQMGARYYQPGSGRFTLLDPLAQSIQTHNRYGYVNGNPTNFTDPTGLFASNCWQFTGWRVRSCYMYFTRYEVLAIGTALGLISLPIGGIGFIFAMIPAWVAYLVGSIVAGTGMIFQFISGMNRGLLTVWTKLNYRVRHYPLAGYWKSYPWYPIGAWPV